MNKQFKLATKRITAVAASAALVSSAVAGAPLANYPSNFVQDGEFNGTVVVGSEAAASDTTAAESLISDMESEFQGGQERVRIDYMEESEGGESIDAVRSNNGLNFGETLGSVTEQGGFDNSDADVLEDGTFNNGISDEDFEQQLTLENGEFNYALRDDVDGVDEITDGMYYENDDTFARYVLEMDNQIDLSGSDAESDLIGEDIEIMGNQFTIGDVNIDGSDDVSELELIGGANKITIGEGESTTVTSGGEDYEVEVQSVSGTASSDKVLLSVNGESMTIDEFDTEEVAGVTVAVSELVPSSRDSVQGFAEVVVGGQKITLTDGDDLVEVNDEEIDDLFDEDYEVYSDFTGSGLDTIEIRYDVADDVLLEEGDSLDDVLFDSFSLTYNGHNDPDFSEIDLLENSDDLSLAGTTEDGVDLNRDFLHMANDESPSSEIWLRGDNDGDRIFHADSIDLSTGANYADPVGVTFDQASGNLTFQINNSNTDGSGFLLEEDEEEQYLYQISSVNTNDAETDFDEFLRDEDEEDIELTNWGTDLGTEFSVLSTNTNSGNENITIDASSELGSLIAFENEMLLDLSVAGASGESVDLSNNDAKLHFRLDDGDVSGDNDAEEDDAIEFSFNRDNNDDEFDITSVDFVGGNFQNEGNADNVEDDSDVRTFVTTYGIMVEYDNDEKRSATIMVPEEQVEADVSLDFGQTGGETQSVTVNADEVEEERESLEEQGYTITGTEEVTSEEVEFDVDGVTLDTEADVAAGNHIVVGGPAVNAAARAYLGIDNYTVEDAGVSEGEGVARYFEDANSVLIYGYSAADTEAIVENVIDGTAEFE